MRSAVDAAIGAVWRIESAKIVAGVARLVRHIGLAEELAGDALVAALEHWPASGIPDNPGAWLMRTAKNAALGHLRREKSYREKCARSSSKAFSRAFEAICATRVNSAPASPRHPSFSSKSPRTARGKTKRHRDTRRMATR